MSIWQVLTLFTLSIILTGCTSIPQSEGLPTVTKVYHNPLYPHPIEYDLFTRDPAALMSPVEFAESNQPPYF